MSGMLQITVQSPTSLTGEFAKEVRVATVETITETKITETKTRSPFLSMSSEVNK